MPRDESALRDMIAAAGLARAFVADLDRAGFERDRKSQSAVLYQLVILGEAAKRLTDAFRLRHPGVPWREIGRLRDKVTHHYRDVDLEIVWSTIEKDLPGFLKDAVAIQQAESGA